MTALDELETAIIEVDAGNNICLVNSAAEQGLAARRERLNGVSLEQAEGLPEELRAAIHATRADQRPRRLHECRLGGGFYDCNIRLLPNAHVLLELHNLEWNREQHQLQQAEVQTGLLDLLRRNLGHEIRNPLGGIRGAAQMMAKELQGQELETLAQLIMREVDRIDELIKRFWQPEMQLREFDIHQALEEALELLASESVGAINLVRDYDPSIPQIQGDGAALRQVFLNLARNAWQSGANRLITRTRIEHGSMLAEQGQGPWLRIDFEDNGGGVPRNLQPLLFLPMVTGRRDGTGLGLAIAQQIAAGHGGLVNFEELREGSLFRVRLPLHGRNGGRIHG